MMSKSWRIVLPAACLAGLTLMGCGRFNKPEVDLRQAYLDARSELLAAAEHSDPVTRANALEAMASTLGDQAGPLYLRSLDDPYPAVRFAAAMAIGEVRYEAAMEKLAAMAATREQSDQAEPDKRVLCAVIYGLHRMGNSDFTSELGMLLYDSEKEVRANAAMVMGLIGEPSAQVPLRTQLQEEQDAAVQLQIVEALAALGDEQNAIRLEAYTKTHFIEDRLVAIEALARRGAPRAPTVLGSLLRTSEPARVRVAAAGALARLGEVRGDAYRLCVRALDQPSKVIRESSEDADVPELQMRSLQRLAAISLGWMKQTDAVNSLQPMLTSDDGPIRVASAMSIVRLGEPYGMSTQPLPPAAWADEPAMAPSPEAPATETAAPAPEPEEDSAPVASPVPLPRLHTAGGKD